MKNITNSKDCLKCKGCCYFLNKKETELAPYFSEKEILGIGKEAVIKRNKFLQAKTVRSRKKASIYICTFLNEKDYRCKIYKKRPVDCILWPFVIGWDKSKRDIYLWSVNNKWCPAINENKIKNDKIINGIIRYLKKIGYLEEIRKNKRPLWPYKNYHIKLNKITKLVV